MDDSLAPICVLHVDDEPQFGELTAEFLDRNERSFSVETALNPGEALDRLSETAFDCIVSDYDMPGRNGIQFLEIVRETHPDLPFILYTGKGSEEVASDAISAGVTDYLQKGSGTSQYEVLANRIENAVEQRRSKEAVTETEQRLQTIAENTNDVLWKFTGDWNELLFVNSVYEDIWGRSIAELEEHPRSFLEGVHPDDRSLVEERMEQLSAGESVDFEFRVNADEDYSRWVWVQGEPIFDDGAKSVVKVVGFARDVTDRKHREQEQEATIEFLRSLNDVVTNPELDPREKISRLLAVGPEKLDLPYGHLTRIETAEDRPGDGMQTVIEASGDHELLQPGDSCPLSQSYCQKTIDSDGVVAIENAMEAGWVGDLAYETFGLDCYIGTPVIVNNELYGTVFFASSTPREEPFTDAEETFVRLMSKWVAYELEREQAKSRLERHNERLEEFVSVVSSDLKNALGEAATRLELAQTDGDSEQFGAVADAIARSGRLSTDLLALVRTGDEVESFESVALDAVVLQRWESIDTGDATLAVESDLTLAADENRLGQLLENLLRNAVQHGGEDVTITVGALDGGFYVADDGPGIPESKRDTVFEAGYTSSSQGTGLGLNIARQIVHAHGWEITVTAGTDGGARFEITGVRSA